ncbi:MAG: hypothetical protein KME42_07560 [Tildeniella nuda ZEHNDER 1965/U140]|nr:hypothetical protein [Tildeniella nuda ZEHNDER 1965/U140]
MAAEVSTTLLTLPQLAQCRCSVRHRGSLWEGRGQKAEGRRQRAEGRRQKHF